MSAGRSSERHPYPTGKLLDGVPRAILFDSVACIGCRQCVEACKDWNVLPRGDYFDISGTTWLTMKPDVLEGRSSVWGRDSCQHCETPLCAAVCPVEAITKYDEGPVIIDQDVCIGCQYCVYACPWKVIGRDPVSHKAAKCTMCGDRLADGGLAPFCVEACPAGALAFGPVEEIAAIAATRAEDASGAHFYGEHEAGGTHVLHLLTRAAAEHGLPSVAPVRYPAHHIPLFRKLAGLLTLTGGLTGKRRALVNAFRRPWRLRYRYWHRPGRPALPADGRSAYVAKSG
jgi:formate dehydrogenase iron-sulfur subunit